MTGTQIIQAAAVFGALAVALGAFGAHGLKPHLDAYQIGIYEKAVFYQFVHTAALLAVGILVKYHGKGNAKLLLFSAYAFIIGILCFSGSLYLLAIRDMVSVPTAVVGPITPIGGLFFLGGWILLALGIGRVEKAATFTVNKNQ